MAQKKGPCAGPGSKNESHRLTIQRWKWLRGEGGTTSYLLRRRDRMMCCLGFLGRSCGLQDAEILGEGTPVNINVPCEADRWAWLTGDDGNTLTDDATKIMHINDYNIIDSHMRKESYSPKSEADREAKLTEIFAQHGIEAVFA